MKSMEALKCDFCGGGLIIADSREFAKCEFCGTKYMASTLRAKIQEIKGTVKVEGAIETTTGNAEKERLLKNAETYIYLNDKNKAINIYNQIQKQFPDDYRGWWECFKLRITENIFNYQELYNSIRLCQNIDVIDDYFNSIIQRFANSVHAINISNRKLEVLDESLNKIQMKEIDSFSKWIIYDLPQIFAIYKNQHLLEFTKQQTNNYANKVFNGEIIPSYNNSFGDGFIFPKPPLCTMWDFEYLGIKMDSKIRNHLIKDSNGKKFVSDLKSFLKTYYFVADNTGYDIRLGHSQDQIKAQGTPQAILGRWLYLQFNYYDGGFKLVRLPTAITPLSLSQCHYRSMNVCQYCGKPFKGVFSKVCSKCGKPKDY